MPQHTYWVYIMTNQSGTLYVGMTRSFCDQVTRLNAMDPLSRN